MNRRDLADVVAYETGTPRKQALASVNVVFETIAEALREGADVRITGFGTFKTSHRKARTGRNPRTGEAVDIPATRSPAFKPSKALKDRINTDHDH
jgi:nucleoid DNA-binding protein